jgi:hypothetical protein
MNADAGSIGLYADAHLCYFRLNLILLFYLSLPLPPKCSVYQTEMPDAGMPMLPDSASMPMSS